MPQPSFKTPLYPGRPTSENLPLLFGLPEECAAVEELLPEPDVNEQAIHIAKLIAAANTINITKGIIFSISNNSAGIAVRLRRQIFRQIIQKFRRHTNVCQEISV